MLKELTYFNKILRSNFGRLRLPHKISYVLTYRCNLRCKMCNIWKKPPVTELSLSQIEKFFTQSNRFSWIGITGGEPFLREDLNQIIRIAGENCKELAAIHFATNGTFTDRIIKTVENTLGAKNRKPKLLFTLSIDGTPDLHDNIRGVTGTWNNCMNTFKELKKNKSVGARIGITLSENNLGKFKEIFHSIKNAYPELKFDDINVNIFNKSSFYYNNQDMPGLDSAKVISQIDEILKMDKDTLTINNFLRRKYLKLYKKFIQLKKSPLKCQALSATCILEPQGDLYPCGTYAVKIANIKDYEYNLKRIWSSPLAKKVSVDCAKGKCPSCWSPCDAFSAIGGSLFDFNLWRG
ncbi:MAG: radical SAM protein [Candidatus Omnitrophica bacterium]|nr:radical SAM protein [Candidatus Omnitrophota bacterium]